MTTVLQERRGDDTDRRSTLVRLVDAVATCFVALAGAMLALMAWAALLFSALVALVVLAWRGGSGVLMAVVKVVGTGLLWVLYALFAVLGGAWELVVALLGDDADLDLGGESRDANEDYHVDRISADVLDKLRADYARGATRRDAHPKHHGLLRASFRVADDVPKEFRVGLFARPGRSFDAWVRLSNASPSVQADAVPDVRGCAIKLCDAQAGAVEPGSSPDHDLLLISEPVFPAHSVGQFSYLQRALRGRSGLHVAWLLYALVTPWHWYMFRNLIRLRLRRHRSVLNIEYHSATPYALGRCLAVRYRMRPQGPVSAGSDIRSRDFLRHELRQRLHADGVTFDFLLQPQRSSRWQPVERPGRAWWQRYAPPVKVATLTLPRQRFDTSEQMQQAEHITYTPWNAPPEHQPLGGINRAREIVYRRTASFRHERNEVARERPTCAELAAVWARQNGES